MRHEPLHVNRPEESEDCIRKGNITQSTKGLLNSYEFEEIGRFLDRNICVEGQKTLQRRRNTVRKEK